MVIFNLMSSYKMCCWTVVGWSPVVVALYRLQRASSLHHRAQKIQNGLWALFSRKCSFQDVLYVDKTASDLLWTSPNERGGDTIIIINMIWHVPLPPSFPTNQERQLQQWLDSYVQCATISGSKFCSTNVFIQLNCSYTICYYYTYCRRNIQISCITIMIIDKHFKIYEYATKFFNPFSTTTCKYHIATGPLHLW